MLLVNTAGTEAKSNKRISSIEMSQICLTCAKKLVAACVANATPCLSYFVCTSELSACIFALGGLFADQ